MNNQRFVPTSEPRTTLSFCPSCDKPFTATTSYTRHVSYCRRARSRPKLRRKSCQACKNAKAKCSFQSRCTRCISKGLECMYEQTPNLGRVPSIDKQSIPSDTLAELEDTNLALTLGDFDIPVHFQSDLLEPETIEELPFFAPSENSSRFIPFGKSVGPMTILDGVSLLPTTWDVPIDLSMNILAAENSDNFQNPGYLTKITLANSIAQRSADLIIDALYAIPRQMLRRETFPLFVHPHWHLPALPEPLAICMQIAGMYFLGSPTLRGFVWRSTLAEQRRAVQRLDTLSSQELLAETQVGMVYLMMRLLDGVARDLEWTCEMMTIQTALCSRFIEMNGFTFCHSEETHPSLTWEDWIYAESRRRTSLVWFLITRTIVVNLKPDCPTIDTPQTLPLPASKMQWEARTREAWVKETEFQFPGMKTIGDLIDIKQHDDEHTSTQMLGAWNARMDNLGSLLNVAVAMV